MHQTGVTASLAQNCLVVFATQSRVMSQKATAAAGGALAVTGSVASLPSLPGFLLPLAGALVSTLGAFNLLRDARLVLLLLERYVVARKAAAHARARVGQRLAAHVLDLFLKVAPVPLVAVLFDALLHVTGG